MLLRPLLMAAALLLAAPGSVSSQGAADTTALVRAVATHIGAGIGARRATLRHFYLGEPASDFDRRVTRHLRAEHGLSMLTAHPDTAFWVVTRGAEFRGDSAAVIVEMGDRRRPGDGIHTGIATTRFVFARVPAGWKFARYVHISDADIGEVRDEPLRWR